MIALLVTPTQCLACYSLLHTPCEWHISVRTRSPTRLQPKGTLGDLELTNPIGEVTCGNETVVMTKIDGRCKSFAKGRRSHLRKEQISLGVLKRLMQSMGRFSYEEVCSHVYGSLGVGAPARCMKA